MDEISKTADSTSAAVVRNGETYLPETRKIEPDSDGFLAGVAACLPPDVAGTVAARRKSAHRGYRRIEIVAILILLAAAAGSVFFWFPKPLPALPFQLDWRYEGPRLTPGSPDIGLYRRARADFDAQRYEAVVRTLNDPLGLLLWERNWTGRDELFYLYFVSCGKNVSHFTDWTRALSFSDALVKSDPDNLQWRYFQLLLNRRKLGSYRDFYDSLRHVPLKDWQFRLDSVREMLRDLRDLRGKVLERKHLPGDRETILKQLDLWEAEFLTFEWMLEGGRGGGSFPDDFGTPGVEAREQAWLLTCKHEDAPDSRAFLDLQLFTLDVLLEQDTLLNRIFWNGAVHGSRKPLEARRDAILRRLPVGEGGAR